MTTDGHTYQINPSNLSHCALYIGSNEELCGIVGVIVKVIWNVSEQMKSRLHWRMLIFPPRLKNVDARDRQRFGLGLTSWALSKPNRLSLNHFWGSQT